MNQALFNVLFFSYCMLAGVYIGKKYADTESFNKGYLKASEEVKAVFIKTIEDLSNERNMWMQVYLDIKKRYEIIVNEFKDKGVIKDI